MQFLSSGIRVCVKCVTVSSTNKKLLEFQGHEGFHVCPHVCLWNMVANLATSLKANPRMEESGCLWSLGGGVEGGRPQEGE